MVVETHYKLTIIFRKVNEKNNCVQAFLPRIYSMCCINGKKLNVYVHMHIVYVQSISRLAILADLKKAMNSSLIHTEPLFARKAHVTFTGFVMKDHPLVALPEKGS